MATLQSINNFHQKLPTTSPIINVSSYDTINNTSIPSSALYFGASQNASSTINHHVGTSISGQLNDHLKYKQQTAAQSYMSAALLFEKMEENISKNVLKQIGVQKNKDNMMVATICNVIDTLVSNFVGIFDERFKFALDQLNKNWMNNINVINNKINGILLNMEENKKLINREVKEKENENEKIENIIKNKNQILMNNINDINKKMILKVHSNEQLINNIINKMDKTNEEKEQLVEILLNDINDIKVSLKEDKMAEIINNKFKKMENNIIKKLNQSSKVMVNNLDEMSKEILNVKNKVNNNMNKLENINKNMVNIKNECKASTFSNDTALQRMGKKSDNNNNKIKKNNVKYKNKKNTKNNNKHKNKNKNKKINNKNNNNNNNNKWSNSALSKEKTIITPSMDHNNTNKVETIWGQTFDPIITRNKELYGETKKDGNTIEFYIECTTFDNEYGGCTEGNIVCINIKNNDNGDFKLYAIIKWHDDLIKEYLIPDRGKDMTSTVVNWFVLDRKPDDDEKDIHFLKLKGKSLDNNICLNKLFMGKNIIL